MQEMLSFNYIPEAYIRTPQYGNMEDAYNYDSWSIRWYTICIVS